ncbi:trihelix transcription factor ASIL2-like [Punica granatum]|uniref:Trihelix transcription factor ASIL2-like n=2 Tax=Punica granatum TaxID=22663 RepID=A0A6P8CVJ2_PUNGR|nr:trihelix transcription factor ASIL2-like [Punica granatum]XP_031387994.1 trihelix transcription factor ASIL2-like [Punica granatum]XP_031387995.1 trihelix transcription factor ASIL2-like [Punica granatum]XP_031387996.1 trihelix transcription factor ASIL2-like [Punica granatum]PKI77600.1 hypothetical protein CRG98_002002 [Punica granatum]
MEDVEDDARYPSNPRGGNQQSGYGSSAITHKLPARSDPYSRPIGNQYLGNGDDDEDDEDDEEELGDENDVENHQNNGLREGANDLDDEEDEDELDEDEDDDDDEDDDNPGSQKNFGGSAGDSERRTKKRKLKSLVSSYEFAPRVPASQPEPLVAAALPSAPKSSFGGRNSLTDWTETETFVLLDAWGDRFLQHGRKSLRSEEWQEVAEKVSEVSKIERTDAQCRNRLDTLKKKYKKEKLKLADEGGSAPIKWVYFKKMDALMSSPPQKQSSVAGLSCGVDSGEYVFTNPRVYLNRANGMDEMRDSPGNSEFSNRDEEDDDDSEGLPPKKRRSRRESNEGSSFKLLADSIFKFSDIYEKIENRKSQQMVEIEKMRMEFQRELEVQRRQIMERAHAEIAKIMEYDDEDNDQDHSGQNASG